MYAIRSYYDLIYHPVGSIYRVFALFYIVRVNNTTKPVDPAIASFSADYGRAWIGCWHHRFIAHNEIP